MHALHGLIVNKQKAGDDDEGIFSRNEEYGSRRA